MGGHSAPPDGKALRMTPDAVVIKVGGSLFSRKDEAPVLDEDAIERFSDGIALLYKELRGRLVFITGGGGYGHGAIRDRDQANPFSLASLTEATFTVKANWAAHLRVAGADAFPLQLAAICSLRDGIPEVTSPLLGQSLRHGILPVLAGDAIFDQHGNLLAFSSDRVPELLTPIIKGRLRVVVLTDVPGIIKGGVSSNQVIDHIDPWSPEHAYAELWEASKWDASGAMRTKLDALVECARWGAECFIMHGYPDMDFSFLTQPYSTWPVELQSTRIIAKDLDGKGWQ